MGAWEREPVEFLQRAPHFTFRHSIAIRTRGENVHGYPIAGDRVFDDSDRFELRRHKPKARSRHLRQVRFLAGHLDIWKLP